MCIVCIIMIILFFNSLFIPEVKKFKMVDLYKGSLSKLLKKVIIQNVLYSKLK